MPAPGKKGKHTAMTAGVTVIDHPLVQHKLTLMRKAETSAAEFRALLREISMLLAYEVTRDLPLTYVPIRTPLASMSAPQLVGKKTVVVSILRAGEGILTGMLELIPSARVGHIGLYRDPQTLVAVEYYFKVPDDLPERDALVVDPMLATGNSAVAALHRLKDMGAKSLKFVCLLAAPEGIRHLHEEHPDVPIYTAAIDAHLNEHGYIIPGLGDAGDRLFGTK
jgi:uracil phosphoribosyltransferase